MSVWGGVSIIIGTSYGLSSIKWYKRGTNAYAGKWMCVCVDASVLSPCDNGAHELIWNTDMKIIFSCLLGLFISSLILINFQKAKSVRWFWVCSGVYMTSIFLFFFRFADSLSFRSSCLFLNFPMCVGTHRLENK